MLSVSPHNAPLPSLAALVLGIGSLIFYLASAFASRLSDDNENRKVRAFNLGLPTIGNYSSLFAISLVSAQTPLSTVFVWFLISGHDYGVRLLLCPVFFAGGSLLMLHVYKALEHQGYFDDDEGGLNGMLPYLAESFTHSHLVSSIVLL